MADPLLNGKPGRIDAVKVPPMRYLAVDGIGAPEGPAYAGAVTALYALAYGARFAGKALGFDEKVGPLEGLWWADDMADFLTGQRDRWRWRMLILAPGWLDELSLESLRAKARQKRPDLACLADVALFTLDEGDCLQALHRGPYSAEGPLIASIHSAIAARGARLGGHHHEIYLSDPRRVAPEKLRTILRQPFRPG